MSRVDPTADYRQHRIRVVVVPVGSMSPAVFRSYFELIQRCAELDVTVTAKDCECLRIQCVVCRFSICPV